MAAPLRKGRDGNTRFSETFGMGTYARSRAKQRSGPEGLESGPWRRDPVVAPCQRVAGWKCPVEGGAAGPEELRPGGLAPCASVTSGPEWLQGVCVVCVVLFLSQFSFPLPHVRHHHVLRSTKKRRFAPPPPPRQPSLIVWCRWGGACSLASPRTWGTLALFSSSAMVVGADVLLPGPQSEACGVCR